MAAQIVFAGPYATLDAPDVGSITVGDLNQDSLADLVFTSASGLTVAVGVGGGNFHVNQVADFGYQMASVQIGRLNGDSWPDIAGASALTAYVTTATGGGNGYLGNAQSVSMATSWTYLSAAQQVRLADLNGDGLDDLVSPIGVRLNQSGMFGAADTLELRLPPSLIAVGDLDGDGKLDVAVSSPSQDAVGIFRGDGTGDFIAADTLVAGSYPYYVGAADINNDGRLDLLVTDRAANALGVYIASGPLGQFAPVQQYPVGQNPVDFATADFDGDHVLDVAVLNQDTPSVSFLRGLGNGEFEAAGSFTCGGTPIGLTFGDFDQDGDNDIAVASFGRDSVELYRNDTSTDVRRQSGPLDKSGLAASVYRIGVSTYLRLNVAEAGPVRVGLYGVDGRKVRSVFDGSVSKGTQSLLLTQGEVPSGVYEWLVMAQRTQLRGKVVILR